MKGVCSPEATEMGGNTPDTDGAGSRASMASATSTLTADQMAATKVAGVRVEPVNPNDEGRVPVSGGCVEPELAATGIEPATGGTLPEAEGRVEGGSVVEGGPVVEATEPEVEEG